MLSRVVWVDYSQHSEHGLVARVSCRLSSGEREDFYVSGVEPWFYALEDEEVDYECVTDVESGYESLFGDSLKRVTTEHPQDTNKIKDEMGKTFESDLPFYRKLSVHDGLSGYIRIPDYIVEEEGKSVVDISEIDTEPTKQEDIQPRVLMADIEVTIGEDTFEETKEKRFRTYYCYFLLR